MDLAVPPSPRLRHQPAGEGAAVVATGRRGTTTVEEDSPDV
jgi:NADH-quinone oxidoreductase subunit H